MVRNDMMRISSSDAASLELSFIKSSVWNSTLFFLTCGGRASVVLLSSHRRKVPKPMQQSEETEKTKRPGESWRGEVCRDRGSAEERNATLRVDAPRR